VGREKGGVESKMREVGGRAGSKGGCVFSAPPRLLPSPFLRPVGSLRGRHGRGEVADPAVPKPLLASFAGNSPIVGAGLPDRPLQAVALERIELRILRMAVSWGGELRAHSLVRSGPIQLLRQRKSTNGKAPSTVERSYLPPAAFISASIPAVGLLSPVHDAHMTAAKQSRFVRSDTAEAASPYTFFCGPHS